MSQDRETLLLEIQGLSTEELTKKFDSLQEEINKKEYEIKMDDKSIKYFLDDFLPNIKWKGYECYAIEQIDKVLRSKWIEKNYKSSKIKVGKDHIEATFHFIKEFVGSTVNDAKLHRKIADAFAIPMAEINKSYQLLRDYSTELNARENAIEQGIGLDSSNSGKMEGPIESPIEGPIVPELKVVKK